MRQDELTDEKQRCDHGYFFGTTCEKCELDRIEMTGFKTKLLTVRREGQVWLVLAVSQRERKGSNTLECVARDGTRKDFTAGDKEVAGLKMVNVRIDAPQAK